MEATRFKEADKVIAELKRKNWQDFTIRVENGLDVEEISTNEIYQNGKLYGIMKRMQGSNPVEITVFDSNGDEVYNKTLNQRFPMEQDEYGTFNALMGVRLQAENKHLKQRYDLDILHKQQLDKIEKERNDAVTKYNAAIEKHEDIKERLRENHERQIQDIEREHKRAIEKLEGTISNQRRIIQKLKLVKAEKDALQKRYDKIEPFSKLVNYGMGLVDEFTPAIAITLGEKVGGTFGDALGQVGMAGLQAKYANLASPQPQEQPKQEPKLPKDIQEFVDFMVLLRNEYPQYSVDMMAVMREVTQNTKFVYFQKIMQILNTPNGAETLNFLFEKSQPNHEVTENERESD